MGVHNGSAWIPEVSGRVCLGAYVRWGAEAFVQNSSDTRVRYLHCLRCRSRNASDDVGLHSCEAPIVLQMWLSFWFERARFVFRVRYSTGALSGEGPGEATAADSDDCSAHGLACLHGILGSCKS